VHCNCIHKCANQGGISGTNSRVFVFNFTTKNSAQMATQKGTHVKSVLWITTTSMGIQIVSKSSNDFWCIGLNFFTFSKHQIFQNVSRSQWTESSETAEWNSRTSPRLLSSMPAIGRWLPRRKHCRVAGWLVRVSRGAWSWYTAYWFRDQRHPIYQGLPLSSGGLRHEQYLQGLFPHLFLYCLRYNAFYDHAIITLHTTYFCAH